jgi:hypothetical protein
MEPTSGLIPLTRHYELSTGPTAAAANSVVAKDFIKLQPAQKEVVAMLIALDLGGTG